MPLTRAPNTCSPILRLMCTSDAITTGLRLGCLYLANTRKHVKKNRMAIKQQRMDRSFIVQHVHENTTFNRIFRLTFSLPPWSVAV